MVDTIVDHVVGEDIPNPNIIECGSRRSGRISTSTKSTRFRDYIVYLQEREFNSIEGIDLVSFPEATFSSNHFHWMAAREDELASMKKNGDWDLVDLFVGRNLLVANGFLRLNAKPMGRWKDIKSGSLQKATTREKA